MTASSNVTRPDDAFVCQFYIAERAGFRDRARNPLRSATRPMHRNATRVFAALEVDEEVDATHQAYA